MRWETKTPSRMMRPLFRLPTFNIGLGQTSPTIIIIIIMADSTIQTMIRELITNIGIQEKIETELSNLLLRSMITINYASWKASLPVITLHHRQQLQLLHRIHHTSINDCRPHLHDTGPFHHNISATTITPILQQQEEAI